jgi:hypothetical protein
MMNQVKCFLLISALAAPAWADPVSAGTLVNLLPINGSVSASRPSVATAPTGETVITWVRTAGFVGPVEVSFLDRAGTLVSGPTTLNMGNLSAVNVSCAATPTGFMVAFDADSGVAGNRDIYYRTYNLTGTETGSGQANTNTNLDESRPACAGRPNGDYIMAWLRTQPFGAPPSSGIFVRRITNTGAAIDPTDVRVDSPTVLNFGRQDGPAVGWWPSGRIIVGWHDGTFNAAASPSDSPDGHGQGLLYRIFDANLMAATAPLVANATTADDQFEAVIACDDRDRAIIGWCGDISPLRVDAWVRRFDDQGTPLDATDLDLTPTNFSSDQFLMSVAATPSGEWLASWMDGSSTTSQPGPRCGWARLAQDRAMITQGLTESGGPATETHAFPRLSMDAFGNFVTAWQVESSTGGVGVRYRRYNRNMITVSTSTPPRGTAFNLTLDSPSDANNIYLLAASGGTGPTPLDTRIIRLTQDVLLEYVVFGGGSNGPIFFNFTGSLDSFGRATTPAVFVPNQPFLAGVTVYFAFATGGGPQFPSGINTISDTVSVTIQ